MNKKDKKLDKTIVKALTIVCEDAKFHVAGFQWLTHVVDYNRFPESLNIICVYATRDDIAKAKEHLMDQYLFLSVSKQLEKINVHINDIERHVSFDSEDARSDI